MMLLGLSAGFHDAAAALLIDGDIVAAVEEERLSRVKHDPEFPGRAAAACMSIAGVEPADIDAVVFHEKPLGVVNRHMSTKLAAGPGGLPGLIARTPSVVHEQLAVPGRIDRWFRRQGVKPPAVLYCEHHTSHLASAFYPSPFQDAAVLAIDGVGEWSTCSLGEGRGRRLEVDLEIRFPDSLGLLYSAFTSYCGFRVNSGEGELMGLAPFGEPVYAELIRERLVTVHDDGSFRLNPRYFSYTRGSKMTNWRFHRLFGGDPRPRGSTPTRREADLAASVQAVTEDIVLGLATTAHERTGLDALCLAGGVALNCVANGRLRRDGPFSDVWVQPAAGDAGSAVGAALWAWHDQLGERRIASAHDAMSGAFLGPSFSPEEIRRWLDAEGVRYEHLDPGVRDEVVARRLARGEVVGWFCGRMEFGPRALGHRSILADPRSAEVQARINAMVKERAAFRPFAPAVLSDRAAEWFGVGSESPYMTFTGEVLECRRTATPADDPGTEDLGARVSQVRSQIPAVTHIDHSARLQTVDAVRNPEFTDLIEAFDRLTGCPVLLNTSFNSRDEPIVCTPADALRTFRRTGLDLLVLEDCIVEAEGVAA